MSERKPKQAKIHLRRDEPLLTTNPKLLLRKRKRDPDLRKWAIMAVVALAAALFAIFLVSRIKYVVPPAK